VHAFGQVASFTLSRKIKPMNLAPALNAHLPPEIRVISARATHEEFHAQKDAKGKKYRYLFLNTAIPSPLYQNRAWWVRRPMDANKMRNEARALLGAQDFKVFQASGANTKTTLREIYSAEIIERPPLIGLEILGNGFLKQMVRGIAGTLAHVATGRAPLGIISQLIKTGNRQALPPTAPAHGLYLVRVYY